MIAQIPSVTYAVSLARPRRIQHASGHVFPFTTLSPDFFFGYETNETGTAKIAVPEKVLVDVLYFRPTRTRLFVDLPEVEFPKTFDWNLTGRMARKIRVAPGERSSSKLFRLCATLRSRNYEMRNVKSAGASPFKQRRITPNRSLGSSRLISSMIWFALTINHNAEEPND